MSHQQHKDQAAEAIQAIPCAVLTASDTRTEETDKSGQIICDRLREAGHTIAAYTILPDEPDQIAVQVRAWAQQQQNGQKNAVRVILINGGTGISRRDATVEAIDALLEKHLPGFGEIFRMLSYEEIGSAAMLSRAVAGLYYDTLIFAMPGSSNAVKLAMDKLIMPELEHLIWEQLR